MLLLTRHVGNLKQHNTPWDAAAVQGNECYRGGKLQNAHLEMRFQAVWEAA